MKKAFRRIGYTILTLFVLANIFMAIQAYHATRFYEHGTHKKKVSEMSFGEKLSAAAFGIQAAKSQVTDSLSIRHSTVMLQTADGIILSAWYLECNTNDTTIKPKGTVIMFHGHAASKSGMINEAEGFYRLGYNVLMVDFRAHGESSGNTCTIGYYESRDVKTAYDYIVEQGEKNIVLWGTSLGAATIIKAIYDDDGVNPAKVILEMPFGSLYGAVKGTMRNNHIPVQPASILLTFWGGVEHGFWAFGFMPQNYASAIHCPVLLQRGENDIRVTEDETQAIYKNIAFANKALVEYADCGHQSLYRKDSAKWVKVVGNFLSK